MTSFSKAGCCSKPLLCSFVLPLLPLTMLSPSLAAEESFFVAGPVSAVFEFPPSANDYHSFSATIWYEPEVPPSNTGANGNAESALFIDAVTRVSFSLFGAGGDLLAEVSEDSLAADFKDAYILLQNDLTGTGPDQVTYHFVVQRDSGQATDVSLVFMDNTGMLVDSVLSVPPPPANGTFDQGQSQVQLGYLEETTIVSDSGTADSSLAGIIALGTVEMVGADETDPYDECAEQARNHGQYVSCVAHINNLLRRDGEISGREKGQRQWQAARKR